MRDRRLVVLTLAAGLILFGRLATEASGQSPKALDQKSIADNRELDRQLLEAHERKDVDMLLGLFSRGPDMFFIAPNGTVNKGLAATRESYVRFFAGLESIRGEIKEVSYFPVADGVVALGTVVFHRKPKDGPPEDRTVVWTDFRRKEGGKWVYLFRHAHWPVQPPAK